MKKKKKKIFAREYGIYILLIGIVMAITGRLFMLQIVQGSELKARGVERRATDQSVLPERGKIFDAQGNVLAQSLPVKEIYADPRRVTEAISKKKTPWTKIDMSLKLAEVLKVSSQEILDKLNKDLAWISLAHQITTVQMEEIKALNMPGLGFKDEQRRVFPMDTLAAPVLGIVNLEGHGVEGVEFYYDSILYGTPGYTSVSQGSYAVTENAANEKPKKGSDLHLTLDSTIQYLVEQQLDDLVRTTRAKRVTIVALDPMNGKVLGMGSRPTFNPNEYNKSDPEDRRNLSISMSYEPGSTFKIITGAAALEEGVIRPNDYFDDPGYFKIGPRLISNWDSDQTAHGSLTFTQGMQLSSNVVLAKVGLKLGREQLYTYMSALGFGKKTGIDIAGEESGLLVQKDKSLEIDMATMSFGQANMVTPIQLLTAISSVANGGILYKPYIVDRITDAMGITKEINPVPVRQVLSKATAKQMTAILESVVNEGTGQLAKIPGIKVAGKTGTAQKVDQKTRGYSETDFIASFAAFAPADDPKIAVLIVIDTPRGESHQGGSLGGPRAKAIMEGALQYYGIPVASDTQSVVNSLQSKVAVRPSPQAVTPTRTPTKGETVVPDLTGLTMRQSGDALAKAELHFNFSGSGLAVSQNPSKGQVVNRGAIINVKFEPLEKTP